MTNVVERTIQTYDTVAEEYSRLHQSVGPVRKQLEFFLENLGGGKRVLDVGCAHGRESAFLKEAGAEVVGIDLSDELLKIAKKEVSGVDFRHMDMRNLDFPDGFFDGLWVNTSFLHLEKQDTLSALKGFGRILKPGGLLFLGIQGHPNIKGEVTETLSDSEKLVVTPEFGSGNPRFFAYYDVDEIQDLLKEASFEILKIMTKKEDETQILWIDVFAKLPDV